MSMGSDEKRIWRFCCLLWVVTGMLLSGGAVVSGQDDQDDGGAFDASGRGNSKRNGAGDVHIWRLTH